MAQMRGCSGIKPRGRGSAGCGGDLSDRRLPRPALRLRAMWVAAVNRRRRRTRSRVPAMLRTGGIVLKFPGHDRAMCGDLPNELLRFVWCVRSRTWVVDRSRAPQAMLRCGEGALRAPARCSQDTPTTIRRQVNRSHMPFTQPNVHCRPSRKCLGHALRAAAVNARRGGMRAATDMRSGVDGGEHSATLDGVMAGGLVRGLSMRPGASAERGHDHARISAHTGGAHSRQDRAVLAHLPRSTP
jgi:hypothetical protein